MLTPVDKSSQYCRSGGRGAVLSGSLGEHGAKVRVNDEGIGLHGSNVWGLLLVVDQWWVNLDGGVLVDVAKGVLHHGLGGGAGGVGGSASHEVVVDAQHHGV